MRTCSKCGEEYRLTPDKPGLIHHCPTCSKETVERLGGNMTWEHKTAPGLEIKPLSKARRFAGLQRRFGAGVTVSLTTSKETAHKDLMGYSAFEKE